MRWCASLRFFVVAIATVTLGVGATGCGRLDTDAVQTEIGNVQSAAAEGALVAFEVERDRTLRSFSLIRTAELHKVAMSAGDSLSATPTEAGLQLDAQHGARLAHEAADLLERLHNSPTDRHVARRVRLGLDAVANAADSLGRKL